MAEQVMWDGHLWGVSKGEHVWTFSRTWKGRMIPFTEQVRVAEAATVAEAVAVLDARLQARLEAERDAWRKAQAARAARGGESRAGQASEEAAYQQTKAVLGALDRGVPVEQIEAALEGRPHRPGKQLYRCPRCRTTGYAGSYPFSTGYPSGLCDDCGG